MVLVVTAVPVERAAGAVRLVSPSRRAVELLVHAPEAVQAARIGRVRVVEGSVSSATPLMPARSRVWVAQSATPGPALNDGTHETATGIQHDVKGSLPAGLPGGPSANSATQAMGSLHGRHSAHDGDRVVGEQTRR